MTFNRKALFAALWGFALGANVHTMFVDFALGIADPLATGIGVAISLGCLGMVAMNIGLRRKPSVVAHE